MDLRLIRTAARVTQTALAGAMGVHRVTVVTLEQRAVVSADMDRRYRAALAQLAERADAA